MAAFSDQDPPPWELNYWHPDVCVDDDNSQLAASMWEVAPLHSQEDFHFFYPWEMVAILGFSMADDGSLSRVRVRGLFEDIYVKGSAHRIDDADADLDAKLGRNDALRTLWMDWADFRDAPFGHTPTALAREWMQKTLLAQVSEGDPYAKDTVGPCEQRRDRHRMPCAPK